MKKIVLIWSTEPRNAAISVDHLRRGELTPHEMHIISRWRQEGVTLEVRYEKSRKIKFSGEVDSVLKELKNPSKFRKFSETPYFLNPDPPIDF